MRSVVGRLIGLAILVLAVAAPALARQEARAAVPPPGAAPVPPAASSAPEQAPARVGRVGFVRGNLAFHLRGETQWSAAGVNYPVASGATFWTDPKSHAVFEIGPTTLDIAANTRLDVVNLNEQVAEFGLPSGRIRLHLRQLDEGQSFAVDLPSGGVWMLQPGEYEIDAGGANQPSRVAVFAGSARFVGKGADIGIKAGQAAMLTGANPVVAKLEPAAPDTFVAWCRSHDYVEHRLAAPYYVSPQLTGYAALDQYGSWGNVPEYGEVWYPRVAAGWVPYSLGRWSWIGPWGWTWIDSEPWGFAPFHYGRWAFIGRRWGWVPGRFARRPVYAPALVAFLGGRWFRGHRGVGWFALGPGEPYWPGYTHDRDYIRRLNGANVRNLDAVLRRGPRGFARLRFRNRRFAVAVRRHVFASAGRVGPAALHLRAATAAHARVALAPPAVRAPAARRLRAAVARGGRRPANTAALPPRRGARRAATGHALATPHATHAPALRAARRLPGHAPVHVFHAPARVAHAPVHVFHAPARVAHAPVHVFHAPVHVAHAPVHVFHAPVRVAHAPVHVFHPPAHVFHAPVQAFHAPAPAFHAPPAAHGFAGFGGGAPHAAPPHPAAAPHPSDNKDHH